MKLQRVISNPKTAKLQKKDAASKKVRCEIKGGGQEMAMIVAELLITTIQVPCSLSFGAESYSET